MSGRSVLRIALLSVAASAVASAAVFAIAAGAFYWPPFSGAAAEAATVTVRIGNSWFCDPGDSACMISDIGDIDVATTIDVDDTVVWEWGPDGSGTGISHTTTHCADDFSLCSGPREWDSSPAKTSGTFSHTFGPEDAGKTFLYRCQIHPFTMRGQVTVQAPPPPPVGGIGGVAEGATLQADSASSSDDGSGGPTYVVIAIASAAATVALAAGVWYARMRRLRQAP